MNEDSLIKFFPPCPLTLELNILYTQGLTISRLCSGHSVFQKTKHVHCIWHGLQIRFGHLADILQWIGGSMRRKHIAEKV